MSTIIIIIIMSLFAQDSNKKTMIQKVKCDADIVKWPVIRKVDKV